MSSPSDRDYEIAAELLAVIQQLPAGVASSRPAASWFDELAARVSAIRAERYAAGEVDATTRAKAAARREDDEAWDRFMCAAISGELALRLPAADLARMADEAVTERKKRKDGGR